MVEGGLVPPSSGPGEAADMAVMGPVDLCSAAGVQAGLDPVCCDAEGMKGP